MLLVFLAGGILESICSAVFFALVEREEKRALRERILRTCAGKLMRGIFFGIAVFVFFAGTAAIIYCLFFSGENTTVQAVAYVEMVLFLISASALCFFLYITFTYVVSTDEGIEAHRLFRKRKFYRYEEISVFNYKTPKGSDKLIGYDADGKVIFKVSESTHIGVQALADRLREKGVRQQASAPRSSDE